MQCQKCRKDTPANNPNCIHCGAKLKFSREQILAQMREEAKAEQERHTARNIRRYSVYAVTFFAVALTVFAVTNTQQKPRPVPVYPILNPPSGAIIQGTTDHSALVQMQPTDLWDDMPALTPE